MILPIVFLSKVIYRSIKPNYLQDKDKSRINNHFRLVDMRQALCKDKYAIRSNCNSFGCALVT